MIEEIVLALKSDLINKDEAERLVAIYFKKYLA